MKEEREHLYTRREKLKTRLDHLLETVPCPNEQLTKTKAEYESVTKRLRQLDETLPEEEEQSSSISQPTDPLLTFRTLLKELDRLSKTRDRLRDLFFSRPRLAMMAQLLHKSGQEAKILLKHPLASELEDFLHEWIHEVEKTKNPDLYKRKIGVYQKRLEAIYARIPPCVGGGC